MSPGIDIHPSSRFGIGTRIYLATALLAGLAVAASSLAWWSYGSVNGAVDLLVDEKLPTLERAHDIAQAATMVVAVAPRLAAANSEAVRTLVGTELAGHEAHLRKLVGQLGADAGADLPVAVKRLSKQIAELDAGSRERLAIDGRIADAVVRLGKARDAFAQVIAPEADEAQFNVVLGLEDAKAAPGGSAPASLGDIAQKDFPIFSLALTLQADVNQLTALLQEVSQMVSVDRLVPARERFQATSQRIAKGLAELGKVSPSDKRTALAEAVLAVGRGPEGLLALKEAELSARDTSAALVAASASSADALRGQVDQALKGAREGADAVAASVRERIAGNKLWLAALGAGSIVAALLIALGFVRPAIVQRLERLWHATRAISHGALDTEVDVRGRDEISEIAASVLTFRDNARALRQAEADKMLAERQATERRREMLESLASAFGDVVAAAATGDFSARVGTQFADPELNALARSLNALLDTVQGGLTETCTVLGKLSRGDLSARISGTYQGAFGDLRESTNRLGHEFEITLAQLFQTIASVRSATGEILAGASDLAQRTTQESNAVSIATDQIATFTSTVLSTATLAGQAVDLARSAEKTAQRGEEVVTATRNAIERIQSSSSRISDIIDLIDEIAFQTNLLALNAAVEAARAGESGRGFAVVAAEVRSLAQRSTNASADVKRLVHVAHDDVDTGVSLVKETAEVFTSIVRSVKDVADLMGTIAGTARGQSDEVAIISREISGIGDMAHQNAALVEETNAAIAVTDEQIQALEVSIDRFHFDPEQARVHRQAA